MGMVLVTVCGCLCANLEYFPEFCDVTTLAQWLLLLLHLLSVAVCPCCCVPVQVPIEKVFNKSLLNKFHWCMDTDSTFRF
jgi:hypothetical protein